MNMNDYLTRFNAQPFQDISLDYLTELQHRHLLHIPFENLDVIRKVPIYLNLQTIYSKVVSGSRGGFCYELNGLFQHLLSMIGYEAHLIAATVLRPSGEWAKPETHAALIVQLDEPYLVDVGFGAATPRLPVPLDGSEQQDVAASYRVQRVDGDRFDLIRNSDSEERTLYRFSSAKKNLLDFHEGVVFNQVSKNSAFTHHDIVTLATLNGRLTLSDHTFTKMEGGQTETRQLSAEEKHSVLQHTFNLQLQME